jgi:hexosaminidase
MKSISLTTLIIVIFITSGCMIKNRPEASEINVSWNAIENNYNNQSLLLSEFIFVNNSKYDLKADWEFYFNTISNIQRDSLGLVKFEHVNGDLWKMTPNNNFILPVNDSINIPFFIAGSIVSITDAPKGGFFLFNDNPDKPESIGDIQIMPINSEKLGKRSSDDIMPIETPQIRFEKYSSYGLSILNHEDILPIIPTPKSITIGDGIYSLSDGTIIYYEDQFVKEAEFLSNALQENMGSKLRIEKKTSDDMPGIYLIEDKQAKPEGYSLDIVKNKITIKSSATAGIFYGIQSLRALLPVSSYKSAVNTIILPCLSVVDDPMFAYRSVHLDVARNFQSKASVLKLLDLMSMYKLNKLHFHFCDDEGWRIEIKSLPELTKVGAYRYFSPSDPNILLPSFGSGPNKEGHSGSGYYTRNEFIDILKYATDRHIEVIPELDMPGHARAAIKSMNARYERIKKDGHLKEAEKYLLKDLNDSSVYRSVQGWDDNVVCVCNEGVYAFLDEVTKELKSMFQEAGAPLTTIHSGGDEVPEGVWEKSPKCQQYLSQHPEIKKAKELQTYFIKRFKGVMDIYNIKTAGWEEIALKNENGQWKPIAELSDKGYIPYVWNSVWGWGMEDVSYKLANAGFQIVLCNVTNLYMDLAYAKDPQEPGYYWGAYTNTRKLFEFTPFDIRNCAYEDKMGNKLNGNELFKGKELITEQGKKNILGIEGLLWTENTQSSEMQEYMIFPKLLGLAERAWAQQPDWASEQNEKIRLEKLNKQWNIFANTLGQRELPKLDYYSSGVGYRIAPPAAIIDNDYLKAMSEFPGIEIKYTTDGSEPNINSKLYTQPVKVINTVKLKSFATNGRSSRTAVVK